MNRAAANSGRDIETKLTAPMAVVSDDLLGHGVRLKYSSISPAVKRSRWHRQRADLREQRYAQSECANEFISRRFIMAW
jgi:hypothetical protein